MQTRHSQLAGPRKTQLFCQSWIPDSNPKANIVIAHGLAEHCDRYQHVAEDFCAAGYAVFALDHVGHGRSEGERCFIKRFSDFVVPLRTFVLSIKKESPTLPIFLLGHSMGGLIVGNYLLDYQSDVNGALFSAPAVMAHRQPPLLQKIRMILTAVLSPKKGVLQLDARGVSRNPEVVKLYQNDPLVYNGALPAGLLLQMTLAMSRLQKQAKNISVPVLIMQGEQDKLVNPKGATALFESVSSQDKHIELYPACYHEIVNEPEYPSAKTLMLNWLNKRC